MKRVFYIETYGNRGQYLKLEINAETHREFTEVDKGIFSNFGYEIEDHIKHESRKYDPVLLKEAQEEKESILRLFGEKKIFVKEVPNGYSSRFISPWFLVTTEIGHILIGWRKRVINIDWSETVIKKSANDIFPDETVIKGDNYIHAWGYDKAQEYINKLHAIK